MNKRRINWNIDLDNDYEVLKELERLEAQIKKYTRYYVVWEGKDLLVSRRVLHMIQSLQAENENLKKAIEFPRG
jgi:hypothetical protein|tara:strand:- start:974 stop:1195 length:222 start_codon:yes stop_codon:yes gene_type:complete